MSHVNWHHKYISKHEDVFIYINITKSYKHELIKDTKIYMNHDGSCRRINMDLAMMNHTSEKSNQGSLHRGAGCDGESHISKCQSLLNHKEEVTWIRSEVLII
jgi:hypothetical protein